MLVKLGRHSLSWHGGTAIDAAKAWKAQLLSWHGGTAIDAAKAWKAQFCHGMGELR